MADITYATDGKELSFVAETPAGEEFFWRTRADRSRR